jgi:hypothetical protein
LLDPVWPRGFNSNTLRYTQKAKKGKKIFCHAGRGAALAADPVQKKTTGPQEKLIIFV